jgi:hypothetical protein
MIERAALARAYREIDCASRKGDGGVLSDVLAEIYRKHGLSGSDDWARRWAEASRDSAWARWAVKAAEEENGGKKCRPPRR